MGIKDKLSGFFRAQEDEYDDFEGAYDDYEDDAAPASYAKDTSSDKQKVVSMRNHAQLQVVLVKPERYEDVTSIADHLNDGKTVVLNLESADRDLSRRIVDFLSGAAYANHGNMRKVSKGTFLIVPNGVDMMGELMLEDFDEGKMYF